MVSDGLGLSGLPGTLCVGCSEEDAEIETAAWAPSLWFWKKSEQSDVRECNRIHFLCPRESREKEKDHLLLLLVSDSYPFFGDSLYSPLTPVVAQIPTLLTPTFSFTIHIHRYSHTPSSCAFCMDISEFLAKLQKQDIANDSKFQALKGNSLNTFPD